MGERKDRGDTDCNDNSIKITQWKHMFFSLPAEFWKHRNTIWDSGKTGETRIATIIQSNLHMRTHVFVVHMHYFYKIVLLHTGENEKHFKTF